MIIPPIKSGRKRKWVKCKTCGGVAYYDYTPYSMSNPILTLPCHHGVGQSMRDSAYYISADVAIIEITGVRDRQCSESLT